MDETPVDAETTELDEQVSYEVIDSATDWGKKCLVDSEGYNYSVKCTNDSIVWWICCTRNKTVRPLCFRRVNSLPQVSIPTFTLQLRDRQQHQGLRQRPTYSNLLWRLPRMFYERTFPRSWSHPCLTPRTWHVQLTESIKSSDQRIQRLYVWAKWGLLTHWIHSWWHMCQWASAHHVYQW